MILSGPHVRLYRSILLCPCTEQSTFAVLQQYTIGVYSYPTSEVLNQCIRIPNSNAMRILETTIFVYANGKLPIINILVLLYE